MPPPTLTDPRTEAPTASIIKSIAPALVVGHAVSHRVVPQLLARVLAAYVQSSSVHAPTVTDAAECVDTLRVLDHDGDVATALRQAVGLRRLCSVDVQGTAVENRDVAALADSDAVVTVTSLDLSCCARLTTRGIRSVVKFKALTSLDVSCCERLNGAAVLARLTELPALEELNVLGLEVTDNDLSLVAKLTTLRVFKVGRSLAASNIQGPGLAALATLPCLEILVISPAAISAGAFQFLAPLAATLRVLTLHNALAGDCDDADPLAVLSRFTVLEDLTIRWCSPCLSAVGDLPKLRTLSLQGRSKFSNDDITALSRTRIETLSLEFARVVPPTLLAVLTDLVDLSLPRLDVPGPVLAALAHYAHLRKLSLSEPGSSDLHCLKDCASLEELVVSASKVATDPLFAHVAAIPKLRSLSVAFTKDLDAEAVEPLVAAKNLTVLHLKSRSVHPDFFIGVKRLVCLEELEVNFGMTIDASLAAHLAAMSRLRVLRLCGSTKATLAQAALPHLVVSD